MRDIFIRHDGLEFYTKTSNHYSPNSWALAHNGWKPTEDDRFWRTADPASVLRIVLLDKHAQMRATAEAVAVIEAARAIIPDELRSVVLRATTSEDELRAKEMKKFQNAEAKLAKTRAREAGILAHLDGADTATIASAYSALKYLAELDEDHASKRNKRGFGKPDADDGHRLSETGSVGIREDDARALEIARRYRGQLPPLLNHSLGIWTKAQAAAAAGGGR